MSFPVKLILIWHLSSQHNQIIIIEKTDYVEYHFKKRICTINILTQQCSILVTAHIHKHEIRLRVCGNRPSRKPFSSSPKSQVLNAAVDSHLDFALIPKSGLLLLQDPSFQSSYVFTITVVIVFVHNLGKGFFIGLLSAKASWTQVFLAMCYSLIPPPSLCYKAPDLTGKVEL